MAIRFHCQRCQQLLGIATRKAGTDIACPKCGVTQTVPDKQTAQAALAMSDRSDAQLDTIDLGSGESDTRAPFFDDLDLDIRPREAASSAARAISPAIAVDTNMVLYHRRTLYVQGVLLATLAVVAFGAGYLVGRGGLTFGQIEPTQSTTADVAMEGSLLWESQQGQTTVDEGAVLIALPIDPPDSVLSTRGLRPQDPDSAAGHKGMKMIEEFGGVYARADISGSVPLIFPREGKYHVLLISRHAARAADSPIAKVDQEGIEKYFHQASGLIGRYKYRWTLEEIHAGRTPIVYSFGLDEQATL